MATMSRQPISSLQPKMQNTVIIGVIIRSQNSKTIDSTRTRWLLNLLCIMTSFLVRNTQIYYIITIDNMGTRAVWNFTLRDSVNDFINAAVWGAVDYINKLFITFSLGSVVEVINAKISERKIDDPNEVYVPGVTSPYHLTLSQNSSLIQMHSSPAVPALQGLLRMPTKNPVGACELSYILENSESLKNQYVDIIVAVSQTREVVTRLGELTKIREFEVGDASTDQSVSLTLWDIEWIKLADKWEPKHTVLFLADAQITYNERIKKSSLTIVRKTIITENPEISETEDMRLAFQNKPDTGSMSPFAIPNPNSITKQMTIHDITNALNRALAAPSDERLQLLVVVIAIVDDMNLDSNDYSLISARCAKCKRIVADGSDSCMNIECPFGSGIKSPMNIVSLNVLINLKDDSGYLVGCRLRDTAAEQVIGCTADVLKGLPIEQRKKMKKKFYKQLCSVRMQILGPSAAYQKPIYNILAMNVMESDDDRYEPLNVDDIDFLDD